MKNIALLSGSSNIELSKKISKELSVDLTTWEQKTFSDGETWIRIMEDLAGKSVFIIQSGQFPQHDHIFELLLLINAAQKQGAKEIHIIFPFMPYRRQERQSTEGEAVAAEVIGSLFSGPAISSVTVCNAHTPVVENFFTQTHYHNIEFWDEYAKYTKEHFSLENTVAVAPDAGSVEDAGEIAQRLGIDLVTCTKFRPSHDVVEIKDISGSVDGKSIVLIDDEINTGGTICSVSAALKKRGAKHATLIATHAVLSGDAQEKLLSPDIDALILSDTIPLSSPNPHLLKKIHIISVAPAIAAHIKKLTD